MRENFNLCSLTVILILLPLTSCRTGFPGEPVPNDQNRMGEAIGYYQMSAHDLRRFKRQVIRLPLDIEPTTVIAVLGMPTDEIPIAPVTLGSLLFLPPPIAGWCIRYWSRYDQTEENFPSIDGMVEIFFDGSYGLSDVNARAAGIVGTTHGKP